MGYFNTGTDAKRVLKFCIKIFQLYLARYIAHEKPHCDKRPLAYIFQAGSQYFLCVIFIGNRS